jgi:hypothetical protein
MERANRAASGSDQGDAAAGRRNIQRIMFRSDSANPDRSPMKWMASRFQARMSYFASTT